MPLRGPFNDSHKSLFPLARIAAFMAQRPPRLRLATLRNRNRLANSSSSSLHELEPKWLRK
eukprot:14398617-Heterocapsa_arctica.AAC.1